MRIHERLRVFVSSSMEELAAERSAVKAALEAVKVDAWIFEIDAGARPESIQQTFLEEVEAADLFIGLYWRGLGRYTREEYEHARKLGKDCLIYEKRADIEGTRDDGLQAFLDRIGKVETGHTIQWFEHAAELGEMAQADVARWQTRAVRERRMPRIREQASPAEASDRRFLEALREKVRRAWIEGVLEKSVHSEALLELGKESRPEAIENPWEGVLELPDQSSRELAAGQSTIDLFGEVGRSLLILGAPGSGKTVMLLDLARDLLRRAERDYGEPVPVVFHLSTWAGGAPGLAEWLADELNGKYQIPRRFGRRWLAECRILPLLDGLDELPEGRRPACVEAINAFVEDVGVPGVAACSRLQEYAALPVRLKLGGAICLKPLREERLIRYFDRAGPRLAGLREALARDAELRSLAETPLMLDVMSLAYRDVGSEELREQRPESTASRRSQLFIAYVQKMLARRRSDRRYAPERTTAWLAWLARRMREHNASIFLVENLQPSWLSKGHQLWLYAVGSRLLAGLVLGLGLILALTATRTEDAPPAPWSWVLLGSMAAAAAVGVLDALRLERAGRKGASGLALGLGRLGLIAGLGVIWLVAVIAVAVVWVVWVVQLEDPRYHNFFTPILAALVFLAMLALSRRRRGQVDEITTVENLSWSWRRFAFAFLTVGVVPALVAYGLAAKYRLPGARILETASGRVVTELPGHASQVFGVFSPGGERVATGSLDETARLWTARDGALIAVLSGHEHFVYQPSFNVDGSRLMTRSADTARLWDGETGALIADLRPYYRVAVFSPDGARILTRSRRETLLWDARGGRRLARLGDAGIEWVKPRFSPEGQLVATIDGRTAKLWNARDGALIAALEGSGGSIDTMLFSPGDERLLTAGRDGTGRLWDGRTGAARAVFDGQARVAAFSPDGRRLVTGGGEDAKAWLRDAESGGPLAPLEDSREFPKAAAFSPDGTRVLVRFPAESRLWNGEDGTLIAVLDGHTGDVASAKFSPDGTRILTACKDGVVRLWDGRDGTAVATFEGRRATFDPGGERVAAITSEQARLWDARDGELLEAFDLDRSDDFFRFSPDGDHLLLTGVPYDFRRLALLLVPLGLVLGVARGLERRPRENKASPNEGIRLSARHAVALGPVGGLIAVLVLGLLVFRFDVALLVDSAFWSGLAGVFVFFSLLTGLWCGGLDVIQHLTLRSILGLAGAAPWRLARFLDHASGHILMRKVGGGYIFIHRLLLEHFAAPDP